MRRRALAILVLALVGVGQPGCSASGAVADVPTTCASGTYHYRGGCLRDPATALTCPTGDPAKTAVAPDGDRLAWCEDGKGRHHGLALAWWPHGVDRRRSHWNHGVLDGPMVSWHANGKRASWNLYTRNRPDGTQLEWHDNGQKAFEGPRPDGVPEGRWVWWDRSGRVTKVACYDQQRAAWESTEAAAIHRRCP